MNADTVIGIARGFVGTKESPKGSNNVVFNTHYYGREVSGSAYPWCAAFVWDVFRLAGASALYYGGGKTASCNELLSYAKKNGLLVTSGYKRGDIVLYNWSGGKTSAEHTGILTCDGAGSTVTAVEGNTSVGDDSNGGEVMERVRDVKYVVGAYRPQYDASGTLTYDDFAAYMARYMRTSGTGGEHSPWADEAIRFVTERGIFNGDGEGNYGWLKPLTREGAAQIIRNIMANTEYKGEENG